MRPRDGEARRLFTGAFGGEPDLIVAAPGRVNLIGDHTDYNDGFVLPAAIDRYVVVALSARPDTTVRLLSESAPSVRFDASSLSRGAGWAEYVKGVVWALELTDIGFDAAVVSDVPIGAGLSSSAALEVGIGLALDQAFSLGRSPLEIAIAGQKAENDWVGMECGLMDQMSVALPTQPSALLIDCLDNSHRSIPVSDDLSIVVLDTGTSRNLTSSPYNQRRAESTSAAAFLGVASLRDLSIADLPRLADVLDETSLRRVKHVVTENERVLEVAEAIARGDGAMAGSLMTRSHASLRDDYESSSPALDAIVGAALASPGCLGARVTGAGWGGCGVALVESDSVDAFVAAASERYETTSGRRGKLYACVPVAGASVVATTTDKE